jgi:hypothetical protein
MSHVQRVLHIRVLVVARSGPVRTATLGAFACDRGISVVGLGAASAARALDEVERWRPDVVVLDATTLPGAIDLAAALGAAPRSPFDLPPATIVVTRDGDGPRTSGLVLRARDGSDEELLDFQGEIVGAVWSAAASRARGASRREA